MVKLCDTVLIKAATSGLKLYSARPNRLVGRLACWHSHFCPFCPLPSTVYSAFAVSSNSLAWSALQVSW
ncbi:hypothetical protein D3C84_668250 [compost metagenome]